MFDSPSILDILEDSASLALAYLDDKVNALTSPLKFVVSSLSHFGIEGITNVEDIIDAINQQSDLVEGIGVRRYFGEIREAVTECKSKKSFILPLKGTNGVREFLMVVYPVGGRHIKCFMFIRLDNTGSSANFDESFYNSYKDNVTELFNFKTLKEHLSRNVRESRLCLFDLNGFKLINDRYGHEVGDKVLHSIGDIMISISDMEAIYYHRSGDEFMILCFADDNYLNDIISKIRTKMQEYWAKEFPQEKDLRLDAAFGVVHLTYGKGKVMDNKEYMVAIEMADIAMYHAKINHEAVHMIKEEEAKQLASREDLSAEVNRLSALVGRR